MTREEWEEKGSRARTGVLFWLITFCIGILLMLLFNREILMAISGIALWCMGICLGELVTMDSCEKHMVFLEDKKGYE